MTQPEFCPCDNDLPDPCPACGARVGYDTCKARYNRKAPEPEVFVMSEQPDNHAGQE